MLRKIRTAVAAILILVAFAAIPVMAAQPSGKDYTGAWEIENTNTSIRMEVSDDGTVHYVIGGDKSSGYHSSCKVDQDGRLYVFENNSISDAYVMMNQNQIRDYEGFTWNRMH